jgi:Ca2+-transporting ATPase
VVIGEASRAAAVTAAPTEPAAAGLSSLDAAARLTRDGANTLPPPRRTRVWQRVLMQLRDPLVAVLLVAAALTVATRDWTDAAVILLVIAVNTAVGVAQEVKADQAITALTALTAPEARVVRDGRQQAVPAAEVVVGDLLVLAEGEIVPADADVLTAAALLVDESALTGESVPVDRSAAAEPLAAGTVVVHGRGRALVTATGADSTLGRIASLLDAGPALTPLQHRLVGVGRALAAAAVVLCSVVMAVGLAQGRPAELMAVTAISLVVAAVPESLPAVVTLALALGARRMAARRALVRRLPAVETLGSVTVLATDKTGTLTEGAMVARTLWTPVGEVRVEGFGYRPHGRLRRCDGSGGAQEDPDVVELLTAAALCNDATLRAPEGTDQDWTVLGDPTEGALLAVAGKAGIERAALTERLSRHAEIPFDSVRRRMTTVHRSADDGGLLVVCKGAPEVVLDPALLVDAPDVIARAAGQAELYARDGMRVLAVAQAERSGTDAGGPAGRRWERGLRLLGLIAIGDPPRASAAATIAACRTAGITPILITGDHPATAGALAEAVGVIDAGDAGAVVDCGGLAPGDTGAMVAGRVFARATPQQKLDIIQARRDGGDVVAMTGDGVNDGPALRRADIGVAMGRRGTEVARQAADLVLADDELGTLVAAVEEGRRVYANIRRFLLYALAGGTAEIVVMLFGPFLGLALPLLPAQILWINLLTHGLPGVALGSEPVERGAMLRPPRPPAESVLGAGLWQRILRVGAVISAVTLGVALWGHATGRPWQSMTFLALGCTQLTVAVASRARPGTRSNPLLPIAVGGALLLQLAGLYLPALRDLLGTSPLSVADVLTVSALSSLGYVALKADRLIGREDPAEPHAAPSQGLSGLSE